MQPSRYLETAAHVSTMITLYSVHHQISIWGHIISNWWFSEVQHFKNYPWQLYPSPSVLGTCLLANFVFKFAVIQHEEKSMTFSNNIHTYVLVTLMKICLHDGMRINYYFKCAVVTWLRVHPCFSFPGTPPVKLFVTEQSLLNFHCISSLKLLSLLPPLFQPYSFSEGLPGLPHEL